jgi:hypothetical protein
MPMGDNIFTNLRELDEFKKIEGFQVEADITMNMRGNKVSMTFEVPCVPFLREGLSLAVKYSCLLFP